MLLADTGLFGGRLTFFGNGTITLSLKKTQYIQIKTQVIESLLLDKS